MCTSRLKRRDVLTLIALAPAVFACTPQTEGPEEIRYGREKCHICGMIISDPAYASEIRGGPDKALYKFDDIGDAVNWLAEQSWKDDPAIEFWVMNSENGTQWLDARKVFYRSGVMSPMAYGFAAVPDQTAGAVPFETMKKAVIDRGLTSRCLPAEAKAS